MAELRKDTISGRWIIVNTDDPKEPKDFEQKRYEHKGGPCPFCYGNEFMTPPEIDAIRHEDTQRNTPGWLVRVVPNKFPVLQIEGNLDSRGIGIFDMTNGIGAHEVVIETPYNDKSLTDLSDEEVAMGIEMFCRRSLDLKKDSRFKYILIFKNHGVLAGASIRHEHSQLIALPMVPKNVVEELNGAERYYELRERCIFCDIIRQELQDKERIVCENSDFVSFCPFVSRFPFEIHIYPKKHEVHFCALESSKRINLARALKEVLLRLKISLSDPAFNFVIHTSPLIGNNYEYYHWHMEIIPRISPVAGFEWGTGFYIVSTPPEVAIRYLREAKV